MHAQTRIRKSKYSKLCMKVKLVELVTQRWRQWSLSILVRDKNFGVELLWVELTKAAGNFFKIWRQVNNKVGEGPEKNFWLRAGKNDWKFRAKFLIVESNTVQLSRTVFWTERRLKFLVYHRILRMLQLKLLWLIINCEHTSLQNSTLNCSKIDIITKNWRLNFFVALNLLTSYSISEVVLASFNDFKKNQCSTKFGVY